MAIFNELLVGRIPKGLQKILGIKGGPPVRAVAGELAPTLEVENFWRHPENLFPSGIIMQGGTSHNGPVAANLNIFQLFNPVNSGALIVCMQIIINKLTSDRVILTVDNVAEGAVQPGGTYLDCRGFGGAAVAATRSVGQIRLLNAAALVGSRIGEMYVLANQAAIWGAPIVLPPGYGVNTNPVTVNTEDGATFIWYERGIEASETS